MSKPQGWSVALIALLAGCGDGDEPRADGGTDAGNTGLAVAGVLADSETSLPIDGVEVCIRDSPAPCTSTGATGRFDLSGLPPGQTFTLRFRKLGYYTQNHMYGPRNTDLSVALLLNSRTFYNAQASVLGLAFDATKGHASAQAGAAGAGATFTLAPASGSGPYYTADDSLRFEPSRTSASATGLVAFANLDPGDYVVTVNLPGRTCVANAPGVAANTASMRVFAGEVTVNDYKCQ